MNVVFLNCRTRLRPNKCAAAAFAVPVYWEGSLLYHVMITRVRNKSRYIERNHLLEGVGKIVVTERKVAEREATVHAYSCLSLISVPSHKSRIKQLAKRKRLFSTLPLPFFYILYTLIFSSSCISQFQLTVVHSAMASKFVSNSNTSAMKPINTPATNKCVYLFFFMLF